jgi:hypothetical protein
MIIVVVVVYDSCWVSYVSSPAGTMTTISMESSP